jgi:peptidoglycan/xylan/chitin deacetylase (PgdA/CDA1 family)
MGIRSRAVEALSSTPLRAPLRWLHNRMRQPLLILAYHRVMPIPDPATFPFDLELISATPEQFDTQMSFLRKHFNPISLSSVVDHITNGTALPARPVVVTFDDGYDDNLHFAGPILKKQGIVPTIFLSTDYVGANQPYWFEMVAYLMMRVPARSILSPGTQDLLPTQDTPESRRASMGQLQESLKRLPHLEMIALLTQWRSEFAGHLNPDEFKLSQILDWDQVRAMDGHGFEFGSHSKSHAVLANLDEPTLREELHESRLYLERELGHSVQTLAYPVGKTFAFSGAVQRVARDSGYVIGAAYISGVNWLGGLNTFDMRRHNVERYHRSARFSAMTAAPNWVL